jgi:hypothetical protein
MPAPTDIGAPPRFLSEVQQTDRDACVLVRSLSAKRSAQVPDMIDAFGGILLRGRVGDMRFTVWSASERDPNTIDEVVYWERNVQEMGINAFTDRYNNGREIRTIILSPLAPVRTALYFMSSFRLFLLGSFVVLLGSALRKKTRLLCGVGRLTLFATAMVFGHLLMDNVRCMILPLLFTAMTATGVADLLWKDFVEARGAEPAPAAHSSESTGSGSALPGA